MPRGGRRPQPAARRFLRNRVVEEHHVNNDRRGRGRKGRVEEVVNTVDERVEPAEAGTNMDVDINTYRCRVGMFVPGGGCGFMSLFFTFDRVVNLLGSLNLVRILLVMAGVEQNPGPVDKYIFRYQYLLVEIGTDVMRKVFDFKVGSDFVKHLSANNNKFNKKLQSLISAKIITADQAQYLPPIDNSPKTTNLDITLLACLLRNVCGLRGDNDPVWKNPQPSDHSLEADLARLKECRNNLQHIGTVLITEADLTVKWNELSQILNRMNTVCGIPNLSSLINDAERMDIDEELKKRHDQSVKTWTDMDHLCDRGIEELKLGQSEISQNQSEIKLGQSEIIQGQSEIKLCQSEIIHGQSEIEHGQSEIIQVQSEIKHGQSETIVGQSEIKHDQSVLKVGQAKIIQDQSYLNVDLAEIKDGQAVLRTGQSEIKLRQSEIKDGQSKLIDCQSEIVQGLSTLNVIQSELRVGQSELKHDLFEIKQGQSELKDLPVLKKSLENVKRRHTEKAERMEDIRNTLHERKPTHMDMESDLRNCLLKIYKEACCTLPVSPLCDDDEDDVEILSFYTPPSLYHVPYHRTQEQEEKYSISSYKEIFCKDDRSFRKIYITGDAGVGKTSFCRRMSFLWCKSQSGESVDDKSVQNDIDFMAKFDFVFYVSLRETQSKNVVTMIIEQLFCNEIDLKNMHNECVENILRKNECIVIMDGLDEWTPKEIGKINIKPLYKCIFVITCRPYQIEKERLSPKDIDRQVQITGIDESSIKRYVTEILKHVNKANRDSKNPDDFIRDVEECGLHEQLRIPIITSHLVAVWFDHELTTMSRALIYSNIVDMLLKRAEKIKSIELPSSVEREVQFPDSLSGLFYFKQHISMLRKICLLSFNILFKQDRCLSELVFTTEQLESEPYCVSLVEMAFLCKYGILSKSKVIGRFGKREQKLSYLHKTYLEYFAALFVSSFDLNRAFDNVVEKWTSINDVVQFEDFFLFYVGLSSEKNKFLFENIYHAISDDLSLCRRNAIVHYNRHSYSTQIKSLQTMVINCRKEVCGSIDQNIVFKLEDFIFDIDSSVHNVNSNVKILKKILWSNRTCVKSIHSVNGKYCDEFDEITSLECVHVGYTFSADYGKFIECMLKNRSTLHTVCIEGVDGTQSPILIPELPVRMHQRVKSGIQSVFHIQPVRSLQHLTSLSLSRVIMKHNSLHNLMNFLSDNVLIENIKMSYVSCDNHKRDGSDCTLTLNLPNHTKLTSLFLQNVNILCKSVNNSSLNSIILYPFSERICSRYIHVFNSVKYSPLEHMYIHTSPWYMLDNKSMKTLTCAVKTLPYIKSIDLRYMKLPDDVLLQLHPDVTQAEIVLHAVTMSRQCFHCFIESFVNNKSVIKVEICECNFTSVVGETHRELSVEESVNYMSEYLTSKPTVNITYKDKTWLYFETTCFQ